MFIVFQFGTVSFLLAQHYIFIEAEGQQPFYLKKGGETFSSTGSGFIILPKLNQKEIDFIVGFPNKLFPETAFKIASIQKDLGFALKKIDGKNWVLEDRQTLTLIKGGPVDVKTASQSLSVSTAGFAELLAEATGDKTLLEKTTLITLPADKSLVSSVKPKANSTVSKALTTTKQSNKSSSFGIIRSYIQSEDSSLLRIAYFEKGAKNNWDTIIVEIEKITKAPLISKSVAQDKLPNSPITASPIVKEVPLDSLKQTMALEKAEDCSNPIALPRDVKELQRKMNKAPSFEIQLELATKAFNEKCFTTKQVKELGSFFWEEQNKLILYSRLRKYVADPSLYGELEQSFLQEGSKKAFREMLNKQQL